MTLKRPLKCRLPEGNHMVRRRTPGRKQQPPNMWLRAQCLTFQGRLRAIRNVISSEAKAGNHGSGGPQTTQNSRPFRANTDTWDPASQAEKPPWRFDLHMYRVFHIIGAWPGTQCWLSCRIRDGNYVSDGPPSNAPNLEILRAKKLSKTRNPGLQSRSKNNRTK